MPRYVIERQYLLPVYEQLLIEAPNLDAACREALDEDAHPWSESANEDFDTASPVVVTRAVELSDQSFLAFEKSNPCNLVSFGHILYNSGLDPLPIPTEFAGDTKE